MHTHFYTLSIYLDKNSYIFNEAIFFLKTPIWTLFGYSGIKICHNGQVYIHFNVNTLFDYNEKVT